MLTDMYAKLFSRITESSLMEEEILVRYTFMMLLAISDQHGLVIGTDIAIARRLNMPVEEFQRCVAVLQQPDKDSNSQEEGGRRVITSDGERGYFIVNYAKYKGIKDEGGRREYMKEYMRNKRALTNPANKSLHELTPVSVSENASASEGECEREIPENLRTPEFMAAWGKWKKHRGQKRAKLTDVAIEMQLEELSKMGPEKAIAALKHSMKNGWTGIFEPDQSKNDHKNTKPNPRNAAMGPGHTNYGEAAKRKSAQFPRAQTEMALQMAEDGNPPPPPPVRS